VFNFISNRRIYNLRDVFTFDPKGSAKFAQIFDYTRAIKSKLSRGTFRRLSRTIDGIYSLNGSYARSNDIAMLKHAYVSVL